MKIVAVLVTYHPDLAELETNLAALRPQVAGLVLVDNGSGAAVRARLEALLAGQGAHCLFQPQNRGLAQAQNAGIALARKAGAAAVLLLDQDSRPAPDMVAALRGGLETLRPRLPAAIGPWHGDPESGPMPDLPPGEMPEMPALIASGSLIPLAAFDAVGPFDEALFIDFVDTEWCFRARAAGYRCFAVRAARMRHRIGAARLRILGRLRAVDAPGRAYYQIRNLCLLARRPAVPRLWLGRMAVRILLRSLGLALLVPPRRARLRAVGQGLWHGLAGRGGRGV